MKPISLPFVYFFVAFFCCLFFVFFQPPFRIVDEQRHYIAAAALADRTAVCSNLLHPINKTHVDLIAKLGMKPTDLFTQPGFDWNYITHYSEEKTSSTVLVKGIACVTPLFGHSFSALGIWLGEMTGQNQLTSFYFARILNAVLGVFLTSAAIAITPYYRRLLFCLGMLPTVLFHYSSITYDTIVVSGFFLIFAVFLRIWVYKKWKWQFLTLLIPGAFGLILKPFYFPLVLPFFGLLFYRISWLRKYLLIGLVVLIGLVASGPVLFARNYSPVTYTGRPFEYQYFHETYDHLIQKYGYSLNAYDQAGSLIDRPGLFVKILLTSLFFIFPINLLEIIGYFGWEKHFFSPFTIIIILVTFVMFFSSEARPKLFTLRQRTVLLGGVLVSFFGLYLFMYLFLTTPGLPYINGVQGKYFIPMILPFFISIIGGNKTTIPVAFTKKPYLYLVIGMFFLSLLFILLDFFVWYSS